MMVYRTAGLPWDTYAQESDNHVVIVFQSCNIGMYSYTLVVNDMENSEARHAPALVFVAADSHHIMTLDLYWYGTHGAGVHALTHKLHHSFRTNAYANNKNEQKKSNQIVGTIPNSTTWVVCGHGHFGFGFFVNP